MQSTHREDMHRPTVHKRILNVLRRGLLRPQHHHPHRRRDLRVRLQIRRHHPADPIPRPQRGPPHPAARIPFQPPRRRAIPHLKFPRIPLPPQIGTPVKLPRIPHQLLPLHPPRHLPTLPILRRYLALPTQIDLARTPPPIHRFQLHGHPPMMPRGIRLRRIRHHPHQRPAPPPPHRRLHHLPQRIMPRTALQKRKDHHPQQN